ncbi:MAG: Sua5/YciO/YrdC/YwlC family protein [Pseudomonadota bacterium]
MTHTDSMLCSQTRLRRAVHVLASGGVVACPTEAVWGLSCDPFDDEAVMEILALKVRPADKGLILAAGNEKQLAFLLDGLPGDIRKKLSLSWPGPNTWLVPHHNRVPALVHGRFDSVAVRVSGHPLMRKLCEEFGGPLVSTSANLAGKTAPRTRLAVQLAFGDALDDILPGRVGDSTQPSTIRDAFTDTVIRP